MPLQDVTLREVWASDRSGSPPPPLPPRLSQLWAAQVEGLGWGRRKEDRLIRLLPSADLRRKAGGAQRSGSAPGR